MAIVAKRFSFLDTETNLGTTDLYNLVDTDPRNMPSLDISSVVGKLDGFLKENRTDDIDSLLKKVGDAEIGVSRITKDFFSGKVDLTGEAASKLNELADKMFDKNSKIQSTVKQLATKCQGFMMGGLGSRKPAKKLIDCGNNTRQDKGTPCNLDLFSDVMSKLSNGLYVPKGIDISALEKMIAGVGGQGYTIGMCNVYPAVTGGITDKNVLNRAAATLLGKVAMDSDMFAVTDIGRHLQDGLSITSVVPDISSKIMSNFELPSEIRDQDLSSFSTGFSLSMTNIDPNWNLSDDGLISSKNLFPGEAPDTERFMRSMTCDKGSFVDNFGDGSEVFDTPDVDFMYAGMDDKFESISDKFDSDYADAFMA